MFNLKDMVTVVLTKPGLEVVESHNRQVREEAERCDTKNKSFLLNKFISLTPVKVDTGNMTMVAPMWVIMGIFGEKLGKFPTVEFIKNGSITKIDRGTPEPQNKYGLIKGQTKSIQVTIKQTMVHDLAYDYNRTVAPYEQNGWVVLTVTPIEHEQWDHPKYIPMFTYNIILKLNDVDAYTRYLDKLTQDKRG